MSKLTQSRRRWNNRLIFGVLVFMLVLNLPTLIKTYLLDDVIESEHPYLLNPYQELQALHTTQWSLTNEQGGWQLNLPSSILPQEFAQRWKTLVGTALTNENYQSLKANLTSPQSIEVWYVDQEEPQRITYYQLPQFWLLKNWQDKWIAVTVEPSYLLPIHNPSSEK
ncbi:hypothetical protein VII00023_01055 [Vibrio ichthyoenteri ATCC 700023]|uniref:50S ribosomal protein L33 n=1 Tax=Vibrio ichthyoenteri ATCC 700023 TaxID=870968 RepID=F9S4K7_9VIBR|nr:hypothetical protein [Vibrio ichthyoenteri]EGU36697.1 hypothetical protein VII00023_01055 [Vibrio ichthyoenteri ATCC 700023]